MKTSDSWILNLPRARRFVGAIRKRLGRIFLDDGYPKVFHRVLERVVSRPGKLLRPMLTLYAAEMAGRPYTRTALDAAVALELVHVSSLILDDIIDESPTRRGAISVHARYGNDVAMISAAALLLRGLESSQLDVQSKLWRGSEQASSLIENAGIRTVAYAAARELALGQALEMRGKIGSRREYLRMIELKTATLFHAATAMGAIAAGLHPAAVDRLKDYGRNLGMAFQVRDDLLDLLGSTRSLGKPAGADIRSKKMTIVSIELCRALGATRARLAGYELGALRSAAARAGVVERIERLIDGYTRRALAAIAAMRDSPAKQGLVALAEIGAGRVS